MRFLPRISLPVHGLAELTLGIVLTVCGFALDLGDIGTLMTLIAGFTLAGVGLGAIQDQPLAVHQTVDRGLVILFAALAIACAAAGGALAALVLLATAGIVLTLETRTRWTRPLA
jgi:hypothetical protein